MLKNLLIMGAPGAGKGTQSEMIANTYKIPHISTGDIFRENIKKSTKLGITAKKFMDGGNLVPDDITNAMVLERLSRNDVSNGFILDGFPRTMNQAVELTKILLNIGKSIDAVINIDVEKDLLLERLTGRRVCKICGRAYHIDFNKPKVDGLCDIDNGKLYQRSDDNPESVRVRLLAYETQTKPLLNYYRDYGLVQNISGSNNKDFVFTAIKEIIEKNDID